MTVWNLTAPVGGPLSFALRHLLSAFAFALVTTLSAHSLRAPTLPVPPLQHGAGGVAWVSGGSGERERAAMGPLAGNLRFTLVLSDRAGEYVVADHLAVRGAQGDVLAASHAGPIIMMRLPPGRYTVVATVRGGTEQREVTIDKGSFTLDWRWRI